VERKELKSVKWKTHIIVYYGNHTRLTVEQFCASFSSFINFRLFTTT